MLCCHVGRAHARPCLSTAWALNRCFAWILGTMAVLAQGGGGGTCLLGSGGGGEILEGFVYSSPFFGSQGVTPF